MSIYIVETNLYGGQLRCKYCERFIKVNGEHFDQFLYEIFHTYLVTEPLVNETKYTTINLSNIC
jgi:hypothetical protein